jgi:hypothetical protein
MNICVNVRTLACVDMPFSPNALESEKEFSDGALSTIDMFEMIVQISFPLD